MNGQTNGIIPTKNTNTIDTILKHPIAFGMVMHSILSTIQCLRKGKMEPFFSIVINRPNNKPGEGKDA